MFICRKCSWGGNMAGSLDALVNGTYSYSTSLSLFDARWFLSFISDETSVFSETAAEPFTSASTDWSAWSVEDWRKGYLVQRCLLMRQTTYGCIFLAGGCRFSTTFPCYRRCSGIGSFRSQSIWRWWCCCCSSRTLFRWNLRTRSS